MAQEISGTVIPLAFSSRSFFLYQWNDRYVPEIHMLDLEEEIVPAHFSLSFLRPAMRFPLPVPVL